MDINLDDIRDAVREWLAENWNISLAVALAMLA